jgi:hypothetical protein
MFQSMLARKPLLASWLHTGRASVAMDYDLDGACSACDHPFGESNHLCVGPVSRIAV